ncbi:AAA family ATPase [Actinotalea sp. K2]|uniref:AAA family ATPase n=1 Tax=Actinotalea sp. K2 TaxID=2939438 RepID=UPI002018356E|nr:AAA family ATPase [Actinotalea sp. K2]MCL3860947.1 AAA family ATPase [Actinotalea sp. K2]
MHLHRLVLQAVGPFAGEHTIDFAELGASGIFLLEGPTGAGKSTLIDAIVFALYGKVASKDASEERLRSGHAAAEVETFVDLVVEVGSGVYRVRRTPAYERPKQRGQGTTKQQAGVRLWRLTSPDRPEDGELMSARLDEAGAELQRLVGLDRAQFVQTIVLPQGEFAGFLRANPEDRRGLLQKVFGTEVYEQMQERLARLRVDAERAITAARAAVADATSRFVGAADLDEDQAREVRVEVERLVGEGTGLLDRVAEHVRRTRAEAQEAASAANIAEQRCAATRQALDDAKELAAAVSRRDTLRAELGRLSGSAAEHAQSLARRDAAHQAAVVAPLLRAVEKARTTVARAEAALDEARTHAPGDLRARVVERPVGEARSTLVAEHEECAALGATLLRLVELEQTLDRRRHDLAALHAAVEDRLVERDRLHAELTARPGARELLAAEVARAATVAAGLDGAEHRATAAEQQLAAAEEVAALTVRLEHAEDRLASAAARARETVAAESAVRAARIAGIAGELAAGLVDGQPCAVCGATEHPRPAQQGPDHVDADRVEAAEVERVAAEKALAEASAGAATLRERLDHRRRATGGLDQEAAKILLLAAQDDVRTAVSAIDRHTRLEQDLVGHDAATVALEARISTLTSTIAGDQSRLTAHREHLGSDVQEVEAARQEASSVQARRADVLERGRLTRTWLDTLDAAGAARTHHAERSAELVSGLSETSFATIDEARAAQLDGPALGALDQRIREYQDALAQVTAGLAEERIAALPAHVDVDVDAARAAHLAADAHATACTGEAARLRHRASSSGTAGQEVERAVAAWARAQQEAGPVVRMANLAAANGGDNAHQLTLATYVLARRFEDVVAAANDRLVVMSGGRYELVRSEEREAVLARKRGLAMKVVDHETESERDPRTLSGGETFYVSLCLALGLADVVTAEAGGIDLGTLFVDEGFGSLDPETLETVLGELGRLRDGGRVVGVVSHVEALKQSIAERIEVRRLEDGSSTLTVRA